MFGYNNTQVVVLRVGVTGSILCNILEGSLFSVIKDQLVEAHYSSEAFTRSSMQYARILPLKTCWLICCRDNKWILDMSNCNPSLLPYGSFENLKSVQILPVEPSITCMIAEHIWIGSFENLLDLCYPSDSNWIQGMTLIHLKGFTLKAHCQCGPCIQGLTVSTNWCLLSFLIGCLMSVIHNHQWLISLFKGSIETAYFWQVSMQFHKFTSKGECVLWKKIHKIIAVPLKSNESFETLLINNSSLLRQELNIYYSHVPLKCFT